MRLADNLARLGNINAAISALDRGALGLQMLGSCTDVRCVPLTRRNLYVLITLHDVTCGESVDVRVSDDWGEQAARYGMYLGIVEATRSKDQLEEWQSAIDAAYSIVKRVYPELSENKIPVLDENDRVVIGRSVDSIRRIHNEVVSNTTSEATELEMMLRGA